MLINTIDVGLRVRIWGAWWLWALSLIFNIIFGDIYRMRAHLQVGRVGADDRMRERHSSNTFNLCHIIQIPIVLETKAERATTSTNANNDNGETTTAND